jgi:hypothetical protein
MRLIQVIEKMYGDSAFSNPALAEYKRAIEGIEKEAKDSLVKIISHKAIETKKPNNNDKL